MRNKNKHERKRAHQIQRAYRRSCRSSIEAKQELHRQTRHEQNLLLNQLKYDSELDFFVPNEEHADWWRFEGCFEEAWLPLKRYKGNGEPFGTPNILPEDHRHIPDKVLTDWKKSKIRDSAYRNYWGNYEPVHKYMNFEATYSALQAVYLDPEKYKFLHEQWSLLQKKMEKQYFPVFLPRLPAYTLIREWMLKLFRTRSNNLRYMADCLVDLGYSLYTSDKEQTIPKEYK